MQVSVIIPNYNQGHLIEKAIKSADDQDYSDSIEIIIVDDASTDDSVSKIQSLIRNLKNPVRFIIRNKNGGLPAARNSGIKVANGEIIAFLDSDDIYYNNKISKSVEIFKKFINVGVVYSDYDIVDMRDGSFRREFKHPFDYRLFSQQCIISTNSLVRKEIFDKVGLYNEEFRTTEDYELWFRVLKYYMAYHIPENLFCYRLHGQNLTIKYRDKIIQQTAELQRKGFS